MDGALMLIQMLNGLQLGVLLFLLAAGLTLVFGIMDFINLAHGAFYMLGAFICATLAIWFDSFLIAVLLSVPITFAIGCSGGIRRRAAVISGGPPGADSRDLRTDTYC